MKETVIVKSSMSRRMEKFFGVLLIIEILAAVLLLILAITKGLIETNDMKKALRVQNGIYEGMYTCPYHNNLYFFNFKGLRNHYKSDHINKLPTMFQLGLKYYLWHWFVMLNIGFNMLVYWLRKKDEIVVTNRNVYGRRLFGKTLILPIYQISAVFNARIFSRIAIVTSMGVIRFFWIDNNRLIATEIRNLINERQANTEMDSSKNNPQPGAYLDELEKLKELLDSGVITQDEFVAKKKQILNPPNNDKAD